MLRKEWNAILKHKFFIIIIIALGLVPAIYNYIFLGSMWNPYGKLDQLPVAVVNLDKTSKLNGKKLDLGSSLVSEMKKDEDLDYHFVSEKQATAGLKSGKYYMKITFPKTFSQKAAGLMTKKPQKVQVAYQTTSGHNYISSKMGETAMKELQIKVSRNIAESYTESVFARLSDLKTGVKKASDGSVKLAQGSSSALTGSSELSTNLKTLASSSLTFKEGTKTLQVGLAQYLTGVAQAKSGATALASGQEEFSAATRQLATGTQTLTNKSSALKAGLSQFQSATSSAAALQQADQKLLTGLSKLSTDTELSVTKKTEIAQLETGLIQLNQAIQAGASDTSAATTVQQDLTQVQAILPTLITDQVTATTAAVEQTSSFKSLNAEAQAEILAAIQNSAGSSSAVQTDLTNVQAKLTDVASQLTTLQNQTKSLAATANTALPAASSTLTDLSNGLTEVHTAVSGQLVPGANQISLGMTAFNQALSSGLTQLETGFGQFSTGLAQANAGAQQLASQSQKLTAGSLQLNAGLEKLQANSASLASGSATLSTGADQLSDGSVKLSAGGSSLTSGLSTLNSGTNQLASSLKTASTELSATHNKKTNADHVADPLSLKHTDRDNVPVNGVGMAPYMICVALFVGAIATTTVVGISFSGKQWKTGREFMLAKIGTNGVIALLQALIVYAAVYLLGLHANFAWLTLFAIILISFAFMALVTFIVTWLGKVGSFVSLVLLILQLATSAGTYPLQLSAKIFQAINPWLPMTYALRMLRQTISLTGNIGFYVLGFVVMIVFFTGMLSFFKKISRFA